MNYADKQIEVKKHALVFTNPLVPYGWQQKEVAPNGITCLFDQKFFQPFGELNRYAVFQPGLLPIFELTENQLEKAQDIFEKMTEEIDSNYLYKYDLLRGLVFELIHFALKMYPGNRLDEKYGNALTEFQHGS